MRVAKHALLSSFTKGMIFLCAFIFLCGVLLTCHKQPNKQNQAFDWQMQEWISTLDTLGYNQSKQNLLQLVYLDLKSKSQLKIPLKPLNQLAQKACTQPDSSLCLAMNNLLMTQALKRKDSVVWAEAHWNIAAYYINQQNYSQAYAHYHKARDGFSQKRHPYYEAKMNYNMAFIKGRLKEYTASEALIYQALPYFKNNAKPLPLYRSYTQLGFLNEELENLDRAQDFHRKAHAVIGQTKDYSHQLGSLNNLGLIAHKRQEYPLAISLYEAALRAEKGLDTDHALKARLLANYAYCLFKAKQEGFLKVAEEAYVIRKQIGNEEGIINSQLHLGEMYASAKAKNKGISLLLEAVKRARQINLKREWLNGLLLLAKYDPINGLKYIEEWQQINREVEHALRKQRHKVAKIEFETAEVKARAQQLKNQRSLLLLILVFIGLLSISILYTYRQKNKVKKVKMLMKKEYELRLERQRERNRIASDLHDSILSKLFGLRLNWGLVGCDNKEQWIAESKAFTQELKQLEDEVHLIARNLKSQPIPHFISHLKVLAEKLIRPTDLQFHYNYFKGAENLRIEAESQQHIIAIVTEVITNSIKHAHAKNIGLIWELKKQHYILHIQDDGKGFDPKKEYGRLGLKSIEQRAGATGAKLKLQSSAKTGTHYELYWAVYQDLLTF